MLVDGPVGLNELVDWDKHSRKSCLIIKVDFEKKKHMIQLFEIPRSICLSNLALIISGDFVS